MKTKRKESTGRPPLDPAKRRDCRIVIYVTKAELARLTALANEASSSVATWLRALWSEL